MERNMIKLTEETTNGLTQLKKDIEALANKEKVKTIYKEKNLLDLGKLSLAVGICTVVLYIGLVMVFNPYTLTDKIPILVLLLAGGSICFGLLHSKKKEN